MYIYQLAVLWRIEVNRSRRGQDAWAGTRDVAAMHSIRCNHVKLLAAEPAFIKARWTGCTGRIVGSTQQDTFAPDVHL